MRVWFRVLLCIVAFLFCAVLGFMIPVFIAQWAFETRSYEDFLLVWVFSVPGCALWGLWRTWRWLHIPRHSGRPGA